ncbi:MAG: lysophospholipid acyltransferase family protein [Dehalococcoidia bacterium]
MIGRHHVLRYGAPLIGRIPAVSYPVAAAVGWATWQFRPGFRRTLIRNMLPLVDGDRDRAASEARLALRNISRYWVDIATIPYRDMSRFEARHIRLVHAERLAALEGNAPVIIVSAHTGGAEICLQAITSRGRAFTALVEQIQPPEMTLQLNRLRSAAGGSFHIAGTAGVRAAFRALKAGDVVGLMADRDIQNNGLCIDLAGRPVRLPRGPWELAARTGATVLPVFATRAWNDRFTVTVEEPFRVEDSPEAICAAMKRFAAVLSPLLRAQPGQWTVPEDFWREHRCGPG